MNCACKPKQNYGYYGLNHHDADCQSYTAGLIMNDKWAAYVQDATPENYDAYVDAAMRFEQLSDIADKLAVQS